MNRRYSTAVMTYKEVQELALLAVSSTAEPSIVMRQRAWSSLIGPALRMPASAPA
jgi:hypothetical protein